MEEEGEKQAEGEVDYLSDINIILLKFYADIWYQTSNNLHIRGNKAKQGHVFQWEN